MSPTAPDSPEPFDAVVIGTGFAGAVTTCRLVEAGLRICVLERGRRYGPRDFPNYPTENLFESQDPHAPPTDVAFPDFSRWLWSQDHGLYDVRDLKDTLSVQAAGYGGGSLIYANVHMRPPQGVFDADWPLEYRGDRLGRYFDLAAYMLQAAPVPQRLTKTLQLQRAGAALGPSGSTTWFRTPLAVTFVDGPNPFGRVQHGCDMRARCWRGCDRGAKNTLDLNYLARAEDAKDGGVPPDIRTLAEVVSIEKHRDEIFAVHYRDLWQRAVDDESTRPVRTVRARYVFLCAGAVNTTELLFNSSELLPDPEAVTRLRVKLGSRYFPNADALAAVFDCEEPQEADFGPTITSALLHTHEPSDDICTLEFTGGRWIPGARPPDSDTVPFPRGTRVRAGTATATLAARPMLDWGDWNSDSVPAAGSLVLEDLVGTFAAGADVEIGGMAVARITSGPLRKPHWFLVEDGGYPPDIEGVVGIFRSPLWLRRNRYLEACMPPRPGATLRRPSTSHLRVDALTEALGATSNRSFSSRGVVARTFAADLSPSGQRPSADPVAADFVPPWLATAASNTRDEIFASATSMILPFLGRVLDQMAFAVARDLDPHTVSQLSNNTVDREKLEFLVRGMLRQAIQIFAGSEVEVADRIARVLFQNVPGSLADIMRLAGDALLWAIGHGHNNRYTSILLIMGRDLYRGRLRSERVDGRNELRAQLPNPVIDSLSDVQERVLRDIASRAWRGELRTNPGWTTLGKRVTVHSQGGCPMGPADTSVTAPDGMVHGCPGLYVMDAAAFPASVGVNPSATITAIAEFKVERFLHAEWSRHRPNTAWESRDHERAAEWWRTQNRSELDPLNRADLVSIRSPTSGIVGLTFKEQMRGFFTACEGNEYLIPGTLDDSAEAEERLETLWRHTRRFAAVESEGISNGTTITLTLQAAVGDLGRLIATTTDGRPSRFSLSGTIEMDDGMGTPPSCFELDTEHSFLIAFVRSRQPVPMRYFRYHLQFRDGNRRRLFEGIKILRDAPGFDVWNDTSTLYFEIRDHDGTAAGQLQRGIARVSLDLFMREQLPSMNVTGTSDPIRCSWALAAYYKHFARELAAVYGKRAQQFTEMLLNLVTGIHV